MRLTLAEPRYLKESISIISELVNEARFKVNSNAIELVAMDPANVAMVIFKMLSSTFTEYDVKEETEIGINLANLKQILRRAGQNDMLTLEITTDNKLQVQIKSARSTRTFSMPIIEFEDKEQKIPELSFTAAIETSSSVLNDAIEDVGIVSESVAFVAEKNRLVIRAEGDLANAKIEINTDEETKIKTESEGMIKARYSIEYLKKVIAGSKISDNVSIKFNNDYPLHIEYKEIDKVQLAFILAPRVENE